MRVLGEFGEGHICTILKLDNHCHSSLANEGTLHLSSFSSFSSCSFIASPSAHHYKQVHHRPLDSVLAIRVSSPIPLSLPVESRSRRIRTSRALILLYRANRPHWHDAHLTQPTGWVALLKARPVQRSHEFPREDLCACQGSPLSLSFLLDVFRRRGSVILHYHVSFRRDGGVHHIRYHPVHIEQGRADLLRDPTKCDADHLVSLGRR